jgi:hypothetical protein
VEPEVGIKPTTYRCAVVDIDSHSGGHEATPSRVTDRIARKGVRQRMKPQMRWAVPTSPSVVGSSIVLPIVAACPERDRHDPGNRRHTPRRPISRAVSTIRADPPFSATNRDSPHEAAPGNRCGQV